MQITRTSKALHRIIGTVLLFPSQNSTGHSRDDLLLGFVQGGGLLDQGEVSLVLDGVEAGGAVVLLEVEVRGGLGGAQELQGVGGVLLLVVGR